jgi:PAS domain S-box-containing protein
MAHADGGVFWYNQRWYEYTGTVLEEMEGWGWQSVHDPEVLPKVLERWQASIAAGTPVDMVFPLRGADGEYRPFLTRAMPVRGKLARWFGTSTDISELRRIEEALQRVSEQRRLALEAAELGTWDYRVDAGTVFLDERCLEIYGLPPGRPIGYQETLAQIHPEDRAGIREMVKQAIAGTGGGTYHREFRVVWPDGSLHWAAAHGRVYFEGEGDQRRAVRFTGVSADITERRRAEQLLRESEERLALAIDATQLGAFDFYPQTGKLIWSDSAKRHFGLPPSAQVSFDTFLRGLHPNDAGRTREVVRNVLRPGSDGQYAAEYRTIGIEDGIERCLSAWGRVFFDPQGQPVRLIGVTLDITERKRLAEALLEGEATTRTLLETASQAIMAASADGAIVMANRMAEDMFGYQPDELLGRPLDTLLPPDVRERLRALRADFDSNPQPHTMATGLELQGLRKDGSIFPIEVSLSRVETIRGRLAVSFVTDITQRKRAEMDLRNRERELRALAGSLLTAQEDERRRMARELHDDVTQRLALLSIEIGKLAARADLSVKETRAQLRSLQKQVIQLSHEVRRLSHGLHPAVIEDFGLGTALEELCEEFGKATGISVRFDGPNDDAGLSRDVAASLYRIAQESLGNAAKHARATEVRVALCVNGGNMQLLVSDNGAGFSGEPWRSRIGLGIVSMKERVRMVNGTLSIASRPGQGTEIIASVPLSGGDGETGANSTG